MASDGNARVEPLQVTLCLIVRRAFAQDGAAACRWSGGGLGGPDVACASTSCEGVYRIGSSANATRCPGRTCYGTGMRVSVPSCCTVAVPPPVTRSTLKWLVSRPSSVTLRRYMLASGPGNSLTHVSPRI